MNVSTVEGGGGLRFCSYAGGGRKERKKLKERRDKARNEGKEEIILRSI
jgi:hypothetical protein